jgi:hypothetical protein
MIKAIGTIPNSGQVRIQSVLMFGSTKRKGCLSIEGAMGPSMEVEQVIR